ncbi:family 43 glycosylhydrolase [Thalassobellus suaedae]|uniref:Family 43 glycosylhydrolase n=1 Tax=Thalassobellus suaedae TaxID=3074124 RepID=A0ABY9XXR1_9FLAO|nr:family 43 glycosylhydrolase [Flavobacteriaceae bacterium HL-DH14]
MNVLRFFVFATVMSISNTIFSQTIEFENPIAEERADPWVYKTDDGIYYLIASVPEYDKIVIRKANSINGLKSAEEKNVWFKHKSGVMGHHIWAPELHKIDGTWYIYFAAGEAENIWNIRMWVLSNDSENPMEGEWKEEGTR